MATFVLPNNDFPLKRQLQMAAAFLLAMGVSELITSICILSSSNGVYAGGVYAGIVCTLTALRGFCLRNRSNVLFLLYFSVFSGIVSIVAATIESSNYSQLASLYACTSSSGTCSYISDYGSYCYASASCEYYTTTGYDCSCVGSSSGTCYGFNIKSCSNILSVLPQQLRAGYILAILCIIASVFLFIASYASYKNTPESTAPTVTTATTVSAPVQAQAHVVTVDYNPPIVVNAVVVSNPIAGNNEKGNDNNI